MEKCSLDPVLSPHSTLIYILTFLCCIVLHFGATMIHFPRWDHSNLIAYLMY